MDSHLPALASFLCKGHCTLMAHCSYYPAAPYLKMQHHINLGNFNIIHMCVCVFKIQESQHISQFS